MDLIKKIEMLAEAKGYASIVFLQNENDFKDFRGSGGTGIDGFFDSSEKEMAKYLSKWDFGEELEYDVTKPWGRMDTVSKVKVPGAGTYWLSYNERLGYAGLSREVTI